MNQIGSRILIALLITALSLGMVPFAPTATIPLAQAETLPSQATSAAHPLETALLEAINAQRVAAGLAPLQRAAAISSVARQRSADMAQRGYFGHHAPDGATAWSLLANAGIGYRSAAEILAENNADEASSVQWAIDGFMNSPFHRAAILDPQAQVAGVGLASAGSMKYYTVLFISTD